MNNYFIRVVLNGADYKDYERLHEKMKSYGFSRDISDGTQIFQLPDATYVGNSTKHIDNIREDIKSIASTVISKNQVLVIKAEVWSGYLIMK